MTLSRRILKNVNSPSKSPKLANSSLRRRTLLKRLSSNGVQFGTASKANLKVVVRIRPENQRELDNNSKSVIDIVDDHMLIFDPKHEENSFFFQGSKQKFRDLSKRHHKDQKFIFEKIFDPSSTNEQVFDVTTKDIVDTILNGYNCSVFAYGATGSGKTYTMLGTPSYPGITFLTVMELYKKIAEVEDEKKCEVAVSYLEVYNEMVRDLLSPGKTLNLHESGTHVQVTGLSLHKPKDAEDLLRILAEGNQNRSQHPTDANAESSRSHAVFQVFVRQHDRSSDVKSGVSIAKLSMIDLAGSERGAVTGFHGARFREGANINKSLLALGNCINALADGKGHIPYRDSKLTRLLKDSIGGNCRSVMIATITKASMSFEDTYNTLRYANRAKTIKTSLKKNFMNVDQHISQYLKIVEDLKGEVTALKEQLRSYEEKEDAPPAAEANSGKDSEAEKKILRILMDLKSELKSRQREILQLETAEKELEYKIYTQRLALVRMNIFAFASKKLEKGISRSERSIQSFQSHIDHIQKQKGPLLEKLSKIKDSIHSLLDDSKTKTIAGGETVEEELPEYLVSKIAQDNLEQNVRDSHQIIEFLQNLVQGLVKERASSEKLTALALVTIKFFFLKLKAEKLCDTDTDEHLQRIYQMLDSSRIEWADLKNTDDSFGEQALSEHITLVPMMDVEKLTNLPILNTINVTPVSLDTTKIYMRSNIKSRTGQDSKSVRELLPTTVEESAHVSSKRFLSLNVTPVRLSERSFDTSLGCEQIHSDVEPLTFNDDRLIKPLCSLGDVSDSHKPRYESILLKNEVNSLKVETPPSPVVHVNNEREANLSTSNTTSSDNVSWEKRRTISSHELNSTVTIEADRKAGEMESNNVLIRAETSSPIAHTSSVYQNSPELNSIHDINTTITLQPNIKIPPDLNSTVTLEPKIESPSDPNSTITLESKIESPPDPNSTITLESKIESPPYPNSAIAIQSKIESLPDPNSTITLESNCPPDPNSTVTLNPTYQSSHTVNSTITFAPKSPTSCNFNCTANVKVNIYNPHDEDEPSSSNNTIISSDTSKYKSALQAEAVPPMSTPIMKSLNRSCSTFCLPRKEASRTPSPRSRIPYSVISENRSSPCQISSSVNETFSVQSDCSQESPNVLQNLTHSTKSKDNLAVPKPGFRKPAFSMTPSKYSFSKLPPSTATSSSKLNSKTFKKCVSVPSLHNSKTLVVPQQKENTLKKSTSFLKPKFLQLNKNQENIPPPKTVAFGSSFSNPQKQTGSKRGFVYAPPGVSDK